MTFGPTKERNFSKKLNKQVKRQAILMALTVKRQASVLTVLDDLKLSETKTRLLASVCKQWQSKRASVSKQRSSLLVVPKKDAELVRAANNLPKVEVIRAQDLNVLSLLANQSIIILEPALAVIEKTFTA